jgi:hypothetical protein
MTIATRDHPVYLAALEARQHDPAGPAWISTADTARLVRDRLATLWPAVRFYVRSSSYSGGSSIRVWYDGIERIEPHASCYCKNGPTILRTEGDPCRVCGYIGRWTRVYRADRPGLEEVESALEPYHGRSFDGSIDMAYSLETWLNPDGSASFAHTSGTAGSMGSVPRADGSRTDPGAVLIHPAASYVFVDAELPYDVRTRVR